MMYPFVAFPKVPRLKREIVITEKVDGTNAQIALVELNSPEALASTDTDPFVLYRMPGLKEGDSSLALYAGSRHRWLTTEGDNFGFAKWAIAHVGELRNLGPGRHYGEWYGLGIQRGYDLPEKRFALFNVARWGAHNPPPACCDVVPIIMRGENADPDKAMAMLALGGSVIAPRFTKPEGVVVFHSASWQLYKLTFDDDGGKWTGQS